MWFFDLEEAYDTTWKYGILNDFCDTDLGGVYPFLYKVSNQSIDISLSDFFD